MLDTPLHVAYATGFGWFRIGGGRGIEPVEGGVEMEVEEGVDVEEREDVLDEVVGWDDGVQGVE